MHLGAVVIITAGSCKVLQVSNYYFLCQMWVCRGTTIDVALHTFASLPVSGSLAWVSVLFWRTKKDRVVGVCLHVLLEILGTLEGLATEVTFVRLQWDMDTDVRGDVITLDGGGSA